MNILIAPDSFKDALPALEVAKAIEEGILLANPDIETTLFPLADGGEGTAEILTYHSKGVWQEVEVMDPLFRKIKAGYGLSSDRTVAFIDMAQASGLQLLKPSERNPLFTTTFGTGQLIKDAIGKGVQKIILGIGGSATNDGGIGMATALGYLFLNGNNESLKGSGQDLTKISSIISPDLTFPETEVLCDVDNPLFGPKGATYVYGPQKGADKEKLEVLEKGMIHLASLCKKKFGSDFSDLPGSGAAGGLGFGCLTFLNAKLSSGIDTVMQLSNFQEELKNADLVITGEGKIDAQTLHGKLISGICKKAKEKGVPVIALAGSMLASNEDIKRIGLQSAHSINSPPVDLPTALSNTYKNLKITIYKLCRKNYSKEK